MAKNIGDWNISVELKWNDMWVGIYWRRKGSCIDIWICLIPCIPIHISWLVEKFNPLQ